MMGRVKEQAYAHTVAGWREWVRLPEAGVPWIKAKLDTGARTSSLHAFDLEEFVRDGDAWVRFGVRPWQESDADEVIVERPVHDRRRVRSSTGHVQERIVVRMPIELFDHTIDAEVSLSNRDEMGFRMLVGRQALREGFVVSARDSFLGGRPPKEIRRRNRGRHVPAG